MGSKPLIKCTFLHRKPRVNLKGKLITLTPKIGGAKTKAAQSWGQISKILLPPATKLGQGYIFTGVCDSVHGGGACEVARGGDGGACVVAGECAWLLRGHVWLPGGMRGCRGGMHGCWGGGGRAWDTTRYGQ